MCDFAILASVNGKAKLIVLELKQGAGDEEDTEQLMQGLLVLQRFFELGRLVPSLEAYFVVGKEADSLMRALRDQLSDFKCGTQPARLTIADCNFKLVIDT